MNDRKLYISTGPGVPATKSPISQAVVIRDTCYISGQLPVDEHGQLVRAGVREQISLALQNLISVARAAGFSNADIVYIDVALTDISNMDIVNAVFHEFFNPGQWPARTVYQAAALPLGSCIKFQGIARK